MSNDFDGGIPLDDVDPEKLGGSGSGPMPGLYHGEVNKVDEAANAGNKVLMVVDVEVLAGTTPNQEGRISKIFFDHVGKDRDATIVCQRRKLQFALAVGITSAEELKALKEQRKPFKPNWNLAVGRQFCFEVEKSDKSKTGTSVGFGIWSLDDPKSANIPKNQGKLAKQGDAKDDPFAGQF